MYVNDKTYFLIGEKCFFHRFCNSSFQTKWTGLWQLTRKFLEYYAIKVNDEWLSPNTQKTFVEGKGYAEHLYSLKDLKVEEKIFIPRNEAVLIILLKFINEGEEKKNVSVEFEIALNIRDWNENWHEREYEISYRKNLFIASSQKGKLVFLSSIPGNFIGYHFYKAHYPSNEAQRCFVTKNFSFDFELIPKEEKVFKFLFSCNNDDIVELNAILQNAETLLEERKREYEEIIEENKFQSEIDFLNELYKVATLNLRNCIVDFKEKRVFIAGYPWFTQVWGRDALLSIIFSPFDKEACKNTLLLLAKNQNNEGKIPNLIFEENVDYNSSDSTPLFPIALESYIKRFSDMALVYTLKENLYKIFEFYKKNKNEYGFIKSEKNSTWMDSLEREGYCIEIQAFWYSALNSLSWLFEVLNDDKSSKEAKELAKALKKNINEKFKKDKYFLDSLESNLETINPIFLPIFEVIPIQKSFVKYIEENFETEVGLSTVNKKSNEYKSDSYHLGATWSHILALHSFLQFKAGRTEKALENLRKIFAKMNDFCLSSIKEVWNSENADIYVNKPLGKEFSSLIQAWGAAAIIKTIDEGLLGLKIDSLSKTIFISPKLEGTFVKHLRIGEDLVKLTIFYKENKVETRYESKLNKEYNIVVLPDI